MIRVRASLGFVLAGLLAVSLAVAATGYELPVSGQARVTFVAGPARLAGEAAELRAGQTLAAPAEIEIGEAGRLELTLPEGSVVRFNSGTRFKLVKALADLRNRQVEVDVALGDCWASVKDFLGDTAFELDSPTAVAGVAGTRYRLNVAETRDSAYYVYKGSVRVRPRWTPAGQPGPLSEVQGPERVPGPSRISREEWTEIVSAGYQFVIRADGRYDRPQRFDEAAQLADPWVKWNMERDALLGW